MNAKAKLSILIDAEISFEVDEKGGVEINNIDIPQQHTEAELQFAPPGMELTPDIEEKLKCILQHATFVLVEHHAAIRVRKAGTAVLEKTVLTAPKGAIH